jgi:hypothetical protein
VSGAELVACVGEKRNVYKIRWRNLMSKGHLDDLGLDGREILKWILNK